MVTTTVENSTTTVETITIDLHSITISTRRKTKTITKSTIQTKETKQKTTIENTIRQERTREAIRETKVLGQHLDLKEHRVEKQELFADKSFTHFGPIWGQSFPTQKSKNLMRYFFALNTGIVNKI